MIKIFLYSYRYNFLIFSSDLCQLNIKIVLILPYELNVATFNKYHRCFNLFLKLHSLLIPAMRPRSSTWLARVDILDLFIPSYGRSIFPTGYDLMLSSSSKNTYMNIYLLHWKLGAVLEAFITSVDFTSISVPTLVSSLDTCTAPRKLKHIIYIHYLK